MTLRTGSEPVEPERWRMPLFIKMFIVVALCLVLFGLMEARVSSPNKNARVTAAAADIKAYGQALDLYQLDNGFYPTTEQSLKALEKKPTTEPMPKNWKGYLASEVRDDPWQRSYIYRSPGIHLPAKYDLYSTGPDHVEGSHDDITNWK